MTTEPELESVPTYRCACSWVGGDPDVRKGRSYCPACWHHERKCVEVFAEGAEITALDGDCLVTVIDRAPKSGECGFWVDADEPLDSALAKVVRERDPDGSGVLGYGWACWYDAQRFDGGDRVMTVVAESEPEPAVAPSPLAESLRHLVDALPDGVTWEDWYWDGADVADLVGEPHEARRAPVSIPDVFLAWGYIQGRAVALNVTPLELLIEEASGGDGDLAALLNKAGGREGCGLAGCEHEHEPEGGA